MVSEDTTPSPPPEQCTCSTAYAGEYLCTTASANLTIRSGHGSSYGSIGKIPSGAIVTVTAASGTGKDDWAHVTYNGVSGYASMEYLQIVSGNLPSADLGSEFTAPILHRESWRTIENSYTEGDKPLVRIEPENGRSEQ
jgi:uncharacterized protein YraI